jgi:hypothetical protein
MIFEKKSKIHLLERKSLIPLLGVLIVFVVSRIIYDRAGIHFQGDTYLGYWQFIDPALLRTDLWRSVFYLHSQPPLMNLVTGIVLQVFPINYEEVFHFLYFLAGIIFGISIYFLGISLRFSPWLSMIVSAWFMISPGTVLYEHWLMYAYPLTVALALSGFCLYQFIRTKKNYWGLIFFTLLSGIALTWSLFHIVWLFGIVALLFIVCAERQKIVLVSFLPMFLVTAWYTKNLVMVGEFTASSWAGMNVSKIATFRMPEDERTQMVKSGELSKFALLPPFRNPSVYLKLLPDTPLTGIPILDEPETSLSGPNHHHLVYVAASKYYLQDAIRVIQAKPTYYLRSVEQAVYIYFHAASDFDLTTGNRDVISVFDLWWNRFFYGQWKNDETSIERNSSMSIEHVGWWIVVSFFIVVAGSIILLWKNRRDPAEPENLLVLFMAYNIFFVTLVGNLMDIGENNRFRFTVDPFILVLFIFLLRNMVIPFFLRLLDKTTSQKV